jgi:DNA-binding beta-propeller fold protein YncE
MMKHLTLAVALFSFCALARAQNPIHYRLLKQTAIGGDGGWDYLTTEEQTRTLYIAHSTQVETYNLERDSLMSPIPNTEGVHGIAIAGRERHGFISCGKSNSVLEFGLVKRDIIQRIPVGDHPDAIIYEYSSHHVFVMCAGNNTISVLDANSGMLLTTIALPGRPEFAVSDERGHVFVNIEDKSQVVKINAHTDSIEAVWKVGPGVGPSAIAMDRGSNRLFIGCGNEKMIVMNAVSGKITQTFPIGKGVDAIVFDPFTKLVFSANGEGNITILQETAQGKFQFAQTLDTKRGARTITYDPDTHDIYLVTADFGPTPPATKEQPKPHPSIVPGTFTLLKYGEGAQ